MDPEPIPDDCLPAPSIIDRLVRPAPLDSQGRAIGGTYDGMTAPEILADRDAYRRACGE